VRRAAILSGAVGAGHDVVSEVLSDSLEEWAWRVRTLDCMALLGDAGAKMGDRVFRSLTSRPALYDGLHFAHFRQGTWLVRLIDREATRRLVPALEDELEREPAELLLATFATGASAAAKLRARGLAADVVVLCTDVDLYWLWVWDEVDLFLVTSRTAAATVRRYAPRASVQIVPPPVRPSFYRAPDQADARRVLGIPEDDPCVLLMGGGWGLGPIAGAARALAERGVHVLAVAGHNRKLEAELRRSTSARLHPFGFTHRIPELMAAADLVITTPGATTCSEARVIGRGLVILDVLPGHGRENLQHELELGDAYACGPAAADVPEVVLAALEDAGRPLATVVRPADEWQLAFGGALASLGLADVAAPEPRQPRQPRQLARTRRLDA
jgi:UDP-N-acetylglucosamine:LPS N-acetylglucosamine transferase